MGFIVTLKLLALSHLPAASHAMLAIGLIYGERDGS
jgi:hypothetical protein